ncbi:MAG: chemotaxis protein [Geobacteraceae bacterium GWB2_52_12]|nr:MAG: chemotaxis protein [Geobacteraceae bacterium GWB2_52_12]
MSIKTKLFLNMALMIIGILIIGGFSLTGMQFVKSKLSVLTEQSTPYQLKLIEMQRSLQEHTSNLIKLVYTSNMKEFAATKSDADKTLAETKSLAAELSSFKASEGAGSSNMGELESITTDIARTTEERLQAEEEGRAADALMKSRLQDASRKLRELEAGMKKTQKGSMAQVSVSNADVKVINQKVKNVQTAAQALNDVKIAILEIAAADTKSAVTIARSKYTVASRLVTQSNLVKAETGKPIARELTEGINEVSKRVTDSQEGLLALKTAILTAPDDDNRAKFKQGMALVNQKLGQLTVAMGDTVEKASEDFNNEDKKFDHSIKGATTAGDIMSLTTELITVGAEVNRLIKEIFAAATTQELDNIRKELNHQFDITSSVQKKISGSQGAQLRGAIASLQEIRGLLLSQNGAADKLQHVLTVKAKSLELNSKLKELVATQREEGKRGATTAQAEQANAVKAVNRIFATNITTVSIVSIVVLILGIVFSTVLARLITTPIKELISMSEQFGNGDFRNKLDESRKDEFGDLARHFNQATMKLNEITGRLTGAIQELSGSAQQLSGTADVLKTGAHDQAEQTTQAVSAMGQMSSSINEVAQNALEASHASQNAQDTAAAGNHVVAQTVQSMESIAQSVKSNAQVVQELGRHSDEIGEIVGTIQDIADQTNLLALNAAIEAARAGEHGHGFAVVADEVRKLATRTTEETHHIAQVIREMQTNTARSVTAMHEGTKKVEEGQQRAEEAISSLKAIVQASSDAVVLVNQIAVSAEEQAAVSTEVTTSMQMINLITKQSETSVRDIATASDKLSHLAVELEQMAAWFKK